MHGLSIRLGRFAAVLAMAFGAVVHASEFPEQRFDRNKSLASLLGSSLTAELHKWDAEFIDAQREHARALANRGDPASLLGAVLLYPRMSQLPESRQTLDVFPDETWRWFDAVRAAAPDDILLAWLEAKSCPVNPQRCDRGAALSRLKRFDPENGAVWVELMVDAVIRDDFPARDRYFQRAATAARYDSYDLLLGRLLLASSDGLSSPPISDELSARFAAFAEASKWPMRLDRAIEMHVFGVWLARAPQLFTDTSVLPCRKAFKSLGKSEDAEACRALFSRMTEDGTLLIVRNMAISVMTRLTRDLPDNDIWESRDRRRNWQSEQSAQLMPNVPPIGYVERVLSHGEHDAMLWLIKRAGVSVEPPADWVSSFHQYSE